MFKKIFEAFIVMGYERTGLMYGECMSYLVYNINPRWLGFPFSWFEKRYSNLGYKLISEDAWMLAGGYGAIDGVKSSLRVLRSDNDTLSPGDLQETEVEYTQSENEYDVVYFTIRRKGEWQ